MNAEQTKMVADFCGRVMALDGETGEGFAGRVQFKAGRKLSKARNTLAAVPISPDSDEKEIAEQVGRQLGILIEDGEYSRLYLVAYRVAASSPFESVRFDIEPDTTIDPERHEPIDLNWDAGAAAMLGGIGAGYERMNRQILNANGELHAMLLSVMERVMDLQLQVVRAEHAGQDRQGVAMAHALNEIAERAMPLLQQLGPTFATGLAGYMAAKAARERAEAARAEGREGPPEEKHAAMGYHLDALEGAMAGIGMHAMSHPDTITPDVRKRMVALMQQANAAAAMFGDALDGEGA